MYVSAILIARIAEGGMGPWHLYLVLLVSISIPRIRPDCNAWTIQLRLCLVFGEGC